MSAPELQEGNCGSVHNGNDLLLVIVESYKQADTSETRRQLLSLVTYLDQQ